MVGMGLGCSVWCARIGASMTCCLGYECEVGRLRRGLGDFDCKNRRGSCGDLSAWDGQLWLAQLCGEGSMRVVKQGDDNIGGWLTASEQIFDPAANQERRLRVRMALPLHSCVGDQPISIARLKRDTERTELTAHPAIIKPGAAMHRKASNDKDTEQHHQPRQESMFRRCGRRRWRCRVWRAHSALLCSAAQTLTTPMAYNSMHQERTNCMSGA